MSLLSIVQNACNEIGIQSTATVIGNSNQLIQSMLALANREVERLARNFAWQRLVKTYTITTASPTLTYPPPPDFDRIRSQTFWDKTGTLPMVGPISDETMALIKNGGLVTSTPPRWQFSGAQIQLDNVPSTPHSLVMTYLTNLRVAVAATPTIPASQAFVNDTDVPLVDEAVVTLGLKWRFLDSKGLPCDQEFKDYEEAVQQLEEWDRGMAKLWANQRGLSARRYPFVGLIGGPF